MYYVTTDDFKIFSDTKLFFDQGFSIVDGTIQKIDLRYYLFLKMRTNTLNWKKISELLK